MDADPTRDAAAEPPVRTSLRLVWLAGLVYAVAVATQPGTAGRHLVAAILTGSTALGWAAWMTARHYRNEPWSVAGVVAMAASGGVLVVLHPVGVVVVGVAGMCAASLFDIVPAALLTAPGVLAAACAVVVSGHPAGVIWGAASGGAAGLAVGMGRRQSAQRVRQEAELALAQQRTEVEHERAEVLEERNRIAREVHDVLGHTLSALSLQLEALGGLIDDAATTDVLRAAAARSSRLVKEGLTETQRTVRVLRDEPVAVLEQISVLARDSDVTIRVQGDPRPLQPATGLALVRVAQEAVTNARKHAAGAAVTITLGFASTRIELTVDNALTGASPLAATGAGFGLQGMRERVALLGGTLTAGPHEHAWQVHAEVPA